MQFSDIDSYVTGRYTSSLDATDRKVHINEVYLDLTRAFTPDITEINDDTLSTTEDEDTLTLTWKARQVKRVFLLNDAARVRLRRVSEQALIRGGDGGLPRYWTPYGNIQSAGANYLRFLVNPAPDGIYPVIVEYEPLPWHYPPIRTFRPIFLKSITTLLPGELLRSLLHIRRTGT